MLFTTEALVTGADVLQAFNPDSALKVMENKEQELLALYRRKHEAILEKNRRLDALVFNARHWWLDDPGLTGALRQIRAFLDNIHRNFSQQSPAWLRIQSAEHRAGRKQQILDALLNYRSVRDAWDSLF